MLKLLSDQTELAIDPWRGGGVAAFKWRGIDIFRSSGDSDSPLELGSFPLVPFCNRIANGYIEKEGQLRTLPAASKFGEHEHALHGMGWISPWATKLSSSDSAVLTLKGDGVLWPWVFEAEQRFQVHADGFSQTISVTNHDEAPMPVGIGIHPYFPNEGATLKTEATGYWRTGPDRLPEEHYDLRKEPRWFANSGFDDCFVGCANPVRIDWPTYHLTIHSSTNLPFTHVYTPPGEDYFCVEPVSHIPDAVNSAFDDDITGLTVLEPGQSMTAECRFQLEHAS
ncbi:aldose 1-epimerase [Erythrobacter sp. F6033]|uniref:aldose 1-epimerase n=1 Tax=Erythrobacter sp. F6033 TaxID=2926401 RepID=UPI001FF60969|nr:aldose 1-epimerase [Erythrobacter sp. F6033]MCK0127623.1 aldose 1-epimerase [Erythrobacter sp. F6033]